MSDTEAVNEQPEELLPVDKIERFPLTEGAFSRVHKGRPDTHIPKEAIPYLLKETRFVDDPAQKQEEWDEDLMMAVGRGRECPFCANNLEVEHDRVGVVTGIRIVQDVSCRCRIYRNYYSRWLNQANVSNNYTHIRLDTLEKQHQNFGNFQFDPDNSKAPSALKNLLDTVRTYQNNCYLLTGKAGTGKTTLLTAMYGRALMTWAVRAFKNERLRGIEAVWKVNANVLAKQQRDWAMRNEGRDAETGEPAILPTVTKNKVLEAVKVGLVPHVFLDEFDKIKLDSAFQLNEFFDIIDAVQSNGGQVVACTNMSVLALRYALGAQHGDAIIRRLIGPRMNEKNPELSADPTVGGFHVDCDAGTFTQDYRLPSIPAPAEPKVITSEAGSGGVKGYKLKVASHSAGSQVTPPASPATPPPSQSPNPTKHSVIFNGPGTHPR